MASDPVAELGADPLGDTIERGLTDIRLELAAGRLWAEGIRHARPVWPPDQLGYLSEDPTEAPVTVGIHLAILALARAFVAETPIGGCPGHECRGVVARSASGFVAETPAGGAVATNARLGWSALLLV